MSLQGSRVFVAIMVLVIGAACSERFPESQVPEWRGSVSVSASGVELVSNPDLPLWSAGAEWRLVEDLRIGSPSGDGPDSFGEVVALGISPNGLVHVLDGQDQQIRVFDQEGRFVRALGRRGSGPGEFQGGFGIGWDSAGDLWVVDAQNGRYSVFDSSGIFVQQHVRRVFGVVYPWLGGFGYDGYLYDVGPTFSADGTSQFMFYRIGFNGELVDSVASIVQPAGVPPLTRTQFALTPRVTFRFDPRGYLWHGWTGQYQIVQRSLEGDTLRVVERVVAPMVVTEAEAATVRAELDSIPPEFREGEVSELPRFKPLFARIHVDDVGNLLIQRTVPVGEHGSLFDVHDAHGRFLGTLESPVAFTTSRALPQFVGDYLYGVTSDSLGVDFVVRMRILR